MFFIRKYIAILIVSILTSSTVKAQSTVAEPAQQGKIFAGTIEDQFDVLLRNTYPYESFKGIRDNLPRFKKNTLDSLNLLREQIKTQYITIENQENSVDSLKQALTASNKLISEANGINFLGMTFDKGNYHTIVWSIIVVLLVLLLFFIQRYKSNSQTAKDSRDTADEIRDEFEQHRKKAMEREQKLKRDLQDELNRAARG